MPENDPHSLLSALNKLEQLRNPSEDSARRRYRRFIVRHLAELHPIDAGSSNEPPITVQLRDASQTGLGFVCDHPLAVGSMWRLCLVSHGRVVGQQTIIVRHGTEVRPGVNLVGAQVAIEAGVLCLLGLDPRQIDKNDGPTEPADDAFLPPSEVA